QPAQPPKPDDLLPQEKTAYTQNSPTVGGIFTIPKNSGGIKTGHLTSPDTELTTLLNVEGKKIPLSRPGLNGNKINIEDANSTLIVQKGTNTLIAFVQQNDLENRYLFNANINQTKNMPKEGALTYKGHSFSLYAKNDKAGKLDTIDDNGLAEFTADFNQKTLTGTIKSSMENSGFEPVEISASITQNTFSGSKNYVSVQGGFFGENAGELAGDYIRKGNDQQNAIGVFRAEKSNN
ncbi:transferrin-binding protein-like solute binding protein, partial [Mannheimia indoligenes]|uniref:transferrin-binding protein-like solute binding protein n=1 Tax=Mannheimia indoligenes TaxID=3103145 RepID=UPI002FE5EF96